MNTGSVRRPGHRKAKINRLRDFPYHCLSVSHCIVDPDTDQLLQRFDDDWAEENVGKTSSKLRRVGLSNRLKATLFEHAVSVI